MSEYCEGGFEDGFYQGVESIKEKLRATLVNRPFSNFKADIMDIIDTELEAEQMSICYHCNSPRQERICGDNYGEWIEEYCPNCGIYRKSGYYKTVEMNDAF